MAASIDKQSILQEISRQFFEMVPIRRIKWRTEFITSSQIGPDEQKAVLQATVLNDMCKMYPPSVAYQKAFIKNLLNKLEGSEVDMCDEIYEVYTDLLQQSEDEDDALCYKTYFLPNGQTVSLQESTHLISQGTTGLSTWQAALHLAEWAIENNGFLKNKKVIELGSGLGFTGIAICKQCDIKSFTFTDCHQQVLYLLRINIENNFSDHQSCAIKVVLPENQSIIRKRKKMIRSIRRQLSVKQDLGIEQSDIMEISCTSSASADDIVEELDDIDDLETNMLAPDEELWEEGDFSDCYKLCFDNRISLKQLDWCKDNDAILDKMAPDIILAADVVFDKDIIPSLVKVLVRLLRKKSDFTPQAFVASTIRNEDTRDFFLVNLANEGLAYEIVEPPKEKIFHYDDIVPIEILRIHYSGT